MVKTRHSGDIDVDSPPKFLSLSNEKSRQTSRNEEAVNVTSDCDRESRAFEKTRHAYNIFEEKVVESRLRPRIGPSHAYNYLDVDSSDEDTMRRAHHRSMREYTADIHRSRYSRSRQMKQEILDEQEDMPRRRPRRRSSPLEEMEHSLEEDDDNNRSRRTRRRQPHFLREEEEAEKPVVRNTRRRRQPSIEDDDIEEVSVLPRGRHRQNSVEEEEEEDLEKENLRRRSSRTRRQVYDTLNQSYLVSIPGRPKHDLEEENGHSDTKDQDSDDNKEFSDMYSRVKRKRVQVKRNMYGVPVNDESDSEQDIQKRNKNNGKEDDDEEEEEEEEEENENEEEENNNNRRSTRRKRLCLPNKQTQIVKSYSLREHKPRTDLYKAPVEERRIKRIQHSIFATTPTKKSTNQTYQSPAQRRNRRKRSAFHSSSSSTSSSDSESSDEKNFKHRKAKSMAKARSRMMPMNFSSNAIPTANVIKDRVKSGASLADVEPMNIDRNVTFNSIGGLGKHIRALKEMVVFPLLYDKVFQRFKVDPPRGVLFYGPPGTGKTLVARALANECSQGDKRVAFFMRKGADCLSKWVGESERQLRLLFDQAYKYRPSIIFFDEIDGLAPVRSSRQDQIHSSIVSTLLALMDGLDSRGEIVVIGATNRIDSLDPALRRPGRFDREFLFPLPSLEARKQILKIHTASWCPKLNDHFVSELAEKCVGYCGADLKALCTEAAMLALRRRYPQIYITNEALQLDVSSINVSAKDFFDGVHNIIPTSQRAVNTPARALAARVCPLLQRQLDRIMNQLSDSFPQCLAQTASLDAAVTTSQAQALAENGVIWEELASDEDEDAPSIFVPSTSSKSSKSRRSTEEAPSTSNSIPTYLNFTSYATSRPATFRPRLMLVGHEGQGQTTCIAPAVIHKMENLPVHVLDLPALYAVTAKTPEESCANVFHEAKRKCPSIVYLPYINQWWDVMADTLRATLLTLIHDLDPSLPLLLLATSEQPYRTLDPVLQSLFSQLSSEVIEMSDPNTDERRAFFKDLLLRQACRHPPQKKQAGEILKLLNESKRVNTSILLKRNKKREKSKHTAGLTTPLPSYIYPFESQSRSELSSNKRKIFEESSVGREACTEIALLEQKTRDCQGPTSSKLRREIIRNNLNHLSKARTALSTLTVKIAKDNVILRPSVKRSHKMVLRSRANHEKLNSNQSARQSWPINQCVVFKSTTPATLVSRKEGNCFQKPQRPHCKCYRAKNKSDSKSKSSSSGRNSSELTSRHERYIRRLHRLEAKMLAGPSHTAECSKPHVRDSHCSLSARHLRYLRRLRKIDAALGHTRSLYSMTYNSSAFKPKAGRHIMRTQPSDRLSGCKSSSVFSCGSFQMLYKNEDRGASGHCGTNSVNRELALPVNLRELRAVRFSSLTSPKPGCSAKTGPSQRKLVDGGFNSQKQIIRQHPRYNLRRQKTLKTPAQRLLEVLPKAAPVKPRELTKEEVKQLVEKEELTLMELRIFLRDVLNKLGSDKKFSIFAKPVNIEDAPDYYEIIEQPMDLSTMMGKIDLHEYSTVRAFVNDIDLICSNALEYNPNRGPMDRVIRHRACALKDTAYAIIKTELDKDFEKMCVEIEESRKRRGEKSETVPNFYYTKPSGRQLPSRSQAIIPSYLENPKPVRSIPKPEGERFSRRVRGLNIDPVPPLEDVEKVFKATRSGGSPTRENKNNCNEDSGTPLGPQSSSTPETCKNDSTYNNQLSGLSKGDATPSDNVSKANDGSASKQGEGSKSQPSSASANSKKKKNKCVWCKPRRKRPRLMFSKQHHNRAGGDEGMEGEISHGEEEEEEEQTDSSSKFSASKQIVVDTSENDTEMKEQRSPARASPRNRSPASAHTVPTISTRRSSMSPRIVPSTSPVFASSSDQQDQEDNKPDKDISALLSPQPTSQVENSAANASEEKETGNSSQKPVSEKRPPSPTAPTESRDRPSVVKRLDLESVIVDSGVGSSVDSNGDSRDSIDHKGEEDTPNKDLGTFSVTEDCNQNCSMELKNKASAILSAPNKEVVVSINRLTSLLNRLVARTDGYTVERLEKIYSHLSQIIYRHRQEFDRANMVTDLERKVDELTKIIPTPSSSLRH